MLRGGRLFAAGGDAENAEFIFVADDIAHDFAVHCRLLRREGVHERRIGDHVYDARDAL